MLPLLISTLLFSCIRQTLEDPFLFIAHVPITIDWSESLLDESDIANVSICAYPTGGGEPIRMLSDNIYFNLLKLPIGEYDILVYNELLGDVKGIESVRADEFDQIRSHITLLEDPKILYDTLRVNDIVAANHSRISTWSLRELVIDSKMVEITRSEEYKSYIEESKSRAEAMRSAATKADKIIARPDLPHFSPSIGVGAEFATRALEDLAEVYPQCENTVLHFNVRVVNLNNAMKVEALLRGTEYGAYLSSERREELYGKRVVYENIVRNRTFDDPKNGKDGYFSLDVNTFGARDEDEKCYIDFSCALNNGKIMKFRFDITERILASGKSKYITINLGDADQPAITLPPSSDAGFNVGDWDDEIIVDIL